jgi:spore germination cell wall hydrolase CwlJ-like protein
MKLASLIYGEGASTDADTMRMIGSTVLNRVDAKRAKEFGSTLDEVIGKGYYAAKDNSPMYQQAVSQKFNDEPSKLAWKRAYQVASGLMTGTLDRVAGHFYFKPEEITKLKKNKGFNFKVVKNTGEYGPYKVYGY